MRVWGLVAPAALPTAVTLLVLPVSALCAGEPDARVLLNASEVHNEVKYAPGAEAVVPRHLLSFRDYMDLALFHPTFGYYSSGRVNFGPDFQTYPMALAPYFGEMVAEQILRMWQGMRQAGTLAADERFTIAEFGAGDGVLAESILSYVERMAKQQQEAGAPWREFQSQLLYICYDRSSALSKAQRLRNARFGSRFEAREADATNPTAAIAPGSLKGVVLSNELPDAFSVHKVILPASGSAEVGFVAPSLSSAYWGKLEKLVPGEVAQEVNEGDRVVRKALLQSTQERTYLSRSAFEALLKAVSSTKDYEPLVESLVFQELYVPASLVPEVAGHLRRYASSYAREMAKLDKGVVTYVNLGAELYIRGAGAILKAGYVMTLDYGGNWEGLLGHSAFGHLRTYGPAHRAVNGNAGLEGDDGQPLPELDTSDPYQGPTLNDLTTDVNFSLLAAEGELAALRTMYYGPQSALRTGTPISLPSSNSWSDTFETNAYYKLMVQQKQGTDPAYTYPQATHETLTSSLNSLTEAQRQRVAEIEKKLRGPVVQ